MSALVAGWVKGQKQRNDSGLTRSLTKLSNRPTTAPTPAAAPLIAPPVPADAPAPELPVADAPAAADTKPKVKEPKSALYGDAPADADAPVHPQTGKKMSNAAIGGIIAGAAVGAAALAGATVWFATRGKGSAAGDFSTS